MEATVDFMEEAVGVDAGEEGEHRELSLLPMEGTRLQPHYGKSPEIGMTTITQSKSLAPEERAWHQTMEPELRQAVVVDTRSQLMST
jgi:hypothetical protein